MIALNAPGHPNIPEIYDFFDDATGNYLVMKYIKGESLEQMIERVRQPLPWREAVEMTIQLASALEYMHSRTDANGKPAPVLHRDIKPANILIDEDKRVWLVDFGLSKAQPTNTAQQGGTTAAGTPGYAPLEQWVQKAVPASDVYSLAATLHHLLTGRDPRSVFTSFDLAAAYREHANFPRLRGLNSTLPAALDGAVAAALRDKPQDRPTITQWKSQLETIVRPQTTGPLFRWQDGTVCGLPEELVQPANQHWNEARRYFTKGDWERWLKAHHHNQIIAQMNSAKTRHKNDDVALDAFLRTLDPTFPSPSLKTNVSSLDFGQMAWQKRQTSKLTLRNNGSGCLHGKLTNLPQWVQVSERRFGTHDQQTIEITVDTSRLTPRKESYTANLLIDAGSGGQKPLPITVAVPEPRLVVSTQSLDLGSTHQGETLTGTFTVQNSGDSAFEGRIDYEADWATISPTTFRCEARQSVQIKVNADTSKLRMGKHETALTIHAKANGWTQNAETKISLRLPWLKTFWQRWAPTLDWAAIGMVFAMLTSTRFILEIWRLFPLPPTNALAGILGAVLGTYLHRYQRSERKSWSGLPAIVLFIFTLIGMVYIASQPHYWWYQIQVLERDAYHVNSVGWSPDGQLLASASDYGTVWLSRRDGKRLLILEGVKVEKVAFSPDSKVLTTASCGKEENGHCVQGEIRLWKPDGTLLTTLEGHTNWVTSVAWSPDGQLLASASCGKRDDEKMSKCVEGEIRLWEKNGELRATLEGHTDRVESVAWSPDGVLLASASGRIQLWSRHGTLLATLEGSTSYPNVVTWSPDSQLLASRSHDEVQLWERDGTRLPNLEGHTGWIENVTWSPKGELLASASRDGTVRLWKRDGTPIATLEGHTSDVNRVAWSPDGQLLASASDDNTIRLWKRDGTPLTTLAGHASDVNSVAWSPDGELLASVGRDDTVRLWWVDD